MIECGNCLVSGAGIDPDCPCCDGTGEYRETMTEWPTQPDRQIFGCPSCGCVYNLPATPDETPPWCFHHNAYRWTHFPDFDPVGWKEHGAEPMIRVTVIPAEE